MNRLFLILGANVGNAELTFNIAEKELQNAVGEIKQRSALYKSPSWGFISFDFYNRALELSTTLSARECLDKVLAIEKKMGRVRSGNTYSDRIIDIDILFYNNEIINEDHLVLPHPRLAIRRFVLLPLAEIAPDFLHPENNQTILDLLKVCPDKAEVVLVPAC